MGWHHATDYMCDSCHEPGGDLQSCEMCGGNVCDGCASMMTTDDYEAETSPVIHHVKRIRLERAAEAAAAASVEAPTSALVASVNGKTVEDDDSASSSDDDDSDDHPYCPECLLEGHVTPEDLIAFLVKRTKYKSRYAATEAYYTKQAIKRIQEEDTTAAAAAAAAADAALQTSSPLSKTQLQPSTAATTTSRKRPLETSD